MTWTAGGIFAGKLLTPQSKKEYEMRVPKKKMVFSSCIEANICNEIAVTSGMNCNLKLSTDNYLCTIDERQGIR